MIKVVFPLSLILYFLAACSTLQTQPMPTVLPPADVTPTQVTANISATIAAPTATYTATKLQEVAPVASTETPSTLIVTQPRIGEELAIAQPLTVSGRLSPAPAQPAKITLYIEVEFGTHPNFDTTTVDTDTGEWLVETFIHPKHVGEATLAVVVDSGATTRLPVQLVYDAADEHSYVNLVTPLALDVAVKSGEVIDVKGSAHNPIDGNVWLRGLEEGGNETLFFLEAPTDENGLWQIAIPVSAEWSGKTLLTEACTGSSDENKVAWCSTFYLTVD